MPALIGCTNPYKYSLAILWYCTWPCYKSWTLISLPAFATIILECQIFVWDAWVWFLHLLPEYKDWIIFYINLSSEFSFHCIHMSFIMEETILNICLLGVIRSNKKPSLHVHDIFTMEKQQEAFFLINPCK